MIFDAPLNTAGEAQAQRLGESLRKQGLWTPPGDSEEKGKQPLVVVSPLTRALQTATLAFPGAPLLAISELTEVQDTVSDIGSSLSDLAERFPHCDFSRCRENWWYHDQRRGPRVSVAEPRASIRHRLDRVRDVLAKLASERQAPVFVIGHSQLFKQLMGSRRKLANCEMARYSIPMGAKRRDE